MMAASGGNASRLPALQARCQALGAAQARGRRAALELYGRRCVGVEGTAPVTPWRQESDNGPAMALEASPLADGRRFAESLLAEEQFPEAAREELLTFELRYRLTDEGLVARRGLMLKVARVGTSRLLAARMPGGRVLRLRLPF